MSEQSDWIADQETIAISKEIERFIVRATGKNTTLMMSKIGGNISLNEHLTIQRTLQVAKACLVTTEIAKDGEREKTVTIINTPAVKSV